MTKADLKTGMIVEMRNGGRYLVMLNPDCEEREFICLQGGFMRLINYRDDLTETTNAKGFDIVKVYTVDKNIANLFDRHSLTRSLRLLWKREEKPVEMTVSEIEKKLGIKNLKIVKE